MYLTEIVSITIVSRCFVPVAPSSSDALTFFQFLTFKLSTSGFRAPSLSLRVRHHQCSTPPFLLLRTCPATSWLRSTIRTRSPHNVCSIQLCIQFWSKRSGSHFGETDCQDAPRSYVSPPTHREQWSRIDYKVLIRSGRTFLLAPGCTPPRPSSRSSTLIYLLR